jgi:predicted anti-sigma-YlaC factor YlaD
MRRALSLTLLALTPAAIACSPKKLAVNAIGNALSGQTSAFATDDDPELIGDAVPFALKTIESLLATSPEHRGLLLSASSGFAQYAYGWIQLPADLEEESQGLERSTAMRLRAKKLYLRARDYGIRGLELRHPGIGRALHGTTDEANAAIAKIDARDTDFVYWTAASWGAAISLYKNDPALSSSIPIVEALLRRGLAVDEDYDQGSFHDLLMALEAGSASIGGSMDEAREHSRRSHELSRDTRAMTFVNDAELIALPRQDRPAFEAALQKALALDVDAHPESRLANTLAQRRARWLLSRTADLFLD